MLTDNTRKQIRDNSDNFIAAMMRSLMVMKLQRRIAYLRYKRMKARKYGLLWRRYNRMIAGCRNEIVEVLDPMWCKN